MLHNKINQISLDKWYLLASAFRKISFILKDKMFISLPLLVILKDNTFFESRWRSRGVARVASIGGGGRDNPCYATGRGVLTCVTGCCRKEGGYQKSANFALCNF